MFPNEQENILYELQQMMVNYELEICRPEFHLFWLFLSKQYKWLYTKIKPIRNILHIWSLIAMILNKFTLTIKISHQKMEKTTQRTFILRAPIGNATTDIWHKTRIELSKHKCVIYSV